MASKMETETETLNPNPKSQTLLKPCTPQKETESARKRRGRPPLKSSRESAAETGQTGQADYEKCREERIRENQERLQKLLDLSSSVKTAFCDSNPNPKRKAFLADLKNGGSSNKKTEIEPLVPTRRSSRLQNVAPVSYVEIKVKKCDGLPKYDVALIEEGKREEIYTEEHEKLLGSYETPWTLFVDGYGKDGKRIYDQVTGKTCHQCRQKTMGHRTSCCKCQLVQGQFCGDCLFMRYGENVLEAKKNPNWICPACRGICNCSLCRLKKGWNPTGALYKKIASLGYKSVAHYLIQTRKASADSIEEVFSEMDGNTMGHTETATPNQKASADSTEKVLSEMNGNTVGHTENISSRLRKRNKA